MAAIATTGTESRRTTALQRLSLSNGARFALPVLALLAVGFLGPLIAVIAFSVAEPRSFAVFGTPTLENYRTIFDPANTVYLSFVWSLVFAAISVVVLALLCYPVAYGLAHVFGRWANLITLLLVFPLFISENIRLFGWLLFFIK
ncbi:MAG: hypothetical protein RLN99_10325, partial [Kiloniellaceae bacterium]